VQVDLKDDRFDVTYDPRLTTVDDLMGSIRDLDFKPEIVTSSGAVQTVATKTIDVAALPAELLELFAVARQDDKSVLLRFTGPG